MSNERLMTGNKFDFTDKNVGKCTKTLKFSEQVLCSKDGDLYRIAVIHHSMFTDAVAVNVTDQEELIDE